MTITRRDLLKCAVGATVLPPVITFPGLLADPPASREGVESEPGPCGSLQELMDSFSAEIEEAIPGCRACCLAATGRPRWLYFYAWRGDLHVSDLMHETDLLSPDAMQDRIKSFQQHFREARA